MDLLPRSFFPKSIICLIFVGLLGFLHSASGANVAVASICTVQGSGFTSPLVGRNVQVSGTVTADFDQSGRKGFYLQSENCDRNPSTSDGIFIYLGEGIDIISEGDRVQVRGWVQEYYGMTEIESTSQDITILSHGNALPASVELAPPFDNTNSKAYFESLEGMRVKLDHGRVVGPTDADDRAWLVRYDLGRNRVLYDDPEGTGEVICVDDGGLVEISPEVQVGDQIESLQGVLDYRVGVYCLQLTASPVFIDSGSNFSVGTVSGLPVYTIATFNMDNLFDTVDDPLTDDEVLSSFEYQRRLEKHALAISQQLEYPTVLAVQEIENAGVLHDLIFRPEIKIYYGALIEEGPDVRGIDLALLYRPDLVNVLEYHTYQGCTGLVDGLEPDGNDDPEHPQNALTCDRDGDGTLDGNRLFSRPPMVAHLRIKPMQGIGQVQDFWVIVCHLKSKVGDTSSLQYTLPRRIEQAQFVAGFVLQIRQTNPESQLVVLGDFNDFPDSQPLIQIQNTGLRGAMGLVERDSRYSYIYQGISQYLDNIYITPQLKLLPVKVEAIHINADYPYSFMTQSGTYIRSSDHDPVRVDFSLVVPQVFLPLVYR